jgi:hypothetical protein
MPCLAAAFAATASTAAGDAVGLSEARIKPSSVTVAPVRRENRTL